MKYFKNMSKIWLRIMAIAFIGTQPAILHAAENNRSPHQTARISRLGFSTQAQDLFNPSQFQTNSIGQLSQRKLDLAEFCRDYPYNSKCRELEQNNESNESPVERSPEEETLPETESTAQTSKSGWAIVPEASTLGLGGQIVRKISPNFNARVGANAFKLGIDVNETEFEYEGDLNLFNVSTLLDLHPFKSSGLRISGGAIFGNNNIEGTADVSDRVSDELGEVEIEGQTIDIRDLNIDNLATIDADIEINNSVAPYVGIGGGNPVGAGKGLGFWWNLGVVFISSPEAEVSSNISNDVPAELREEVEAAADRALENEERDLEEELDVINLYPVVSLGLSYQF